MSNILAMEQYIKKSAVNAEIKRLLKSAEAYLKYHHDINNKSVYAFRQQQLVMCELLSFLDTLEVKEVDLDKPFEGIKVQTSMESGSLDEVIVTTKYKAQKGE